MKTEILLAERDRATEALHESEQRYKRLLEATTDYIYTVQLEGGQTRSTSHGPGCEAVTGYSPEDFSRNPYLWYHIVHDEDRVLVLEQIEHILKGEVPPPLEHRLIRRNGAVRWIRNRTIPHYSENGKLYGYDGLISDITERKLADEALAAERKLLRTLIDSVPELIFALDRERHFTLVNLAQAQALGAKSPADVVGRVIADFVPAIQALKEQLAEETVFRLGEPQFNSEESEVDAAGQRRWFAATRVPLKDARGTVVGLVGIKHDVTEHEKAQQALRESQERLSLVIRGSTDGIWDWNILTGEAYFSPRWKSMLGYADDEIDNHFSAWEELMHPDDLPIARERVRAYLAGSIPSYELEHRLRHKDGTYRWTLARGVVLRDRDRRPIRMAGSHMDVTELKNSTEQLKKVNRDLIDTRDQLVLAARFESMGTLAAGVAHEVKNPLQTILMGLHFLGQKLHGVSEDVGLTLKDMRDSVMRANAIVGDLLTLSRVTPFRTQPGSLNRVIEQCLRLTKIEMETAGVTPQTQLDPDLPDVIVDETKMEQVFLNLLLNAVQAMPGGGVLNVTTRALVTDRDPAAIPPLLRKFQPGQRVVVAEVRDTGTGIKPVDLPRVFDAFFTTKQVGVGTGLGLPIARMIIDRHGGVIDIANGAGTGVVATVALKCDSGGSHETQTHSGGG